MVVLPCTSVSQLQVVGTLKLHTRHARLLNLAMRAEYTSCLRKKVCHFYFRDSFGDNGPIFIFLLLISLSLN